MKLVQEYKQNKVVQRKWKRRKILNQMLDALRHQTWQICKQATLLLQESCKEDEALEPLLDAVRVLTVMLRKTEGETEKEAGNTMCLVAYKHI